MRDGSVPLQPPRPLALCLAALILTSALAGCGSMAPRGATGAAPAAPAAARGGGYYLNDGPGDHPPPNLEQVADAAPKIEPLKSGAMKPYTVLGHTYTPMTELTPYRERGIASWYGRRYDGQKTASGEIYDMYAMTAAHPTLPIPSYARVTNLQNGRSVVVRINDRGPFLYDRIIDLSYTAAYKLGVLGGGKQLVEVDAVIPGMEAPPAVNVAANAPAPVAVPAPPATTAATAGVAVTAAVPALISSAAAAEPAGPAATPMPATTPAPAVAASTPPVVAIAAEPQGNFLQLGAFGSQDNAGNYLARLRAQLDDALASSLHIYQKGDGLFRVQSGPYPDQAAARQAADRLNQALGIKAIVVTR